MPGGQSGFALWLTGLPSSGKTTLAHALHRQLASRGIAVQVLDSDELRQRLTPNPTYTPEERDWFYGMVAYLAELLADNGVNVLIAATASRRTYRQAARERIPRFAEVYVECAPAVCRARDPKGLWERAAEGQITGLPGADAPYEPPVAPEARVDTARTSVEEAAGQVMAQLEAQGFLGHDPAGSAWRPTS
jgi:adenylylsulfate kinase